MNFEDFDYVISCIEKRSTCIIIRNNYNWSSFVWSEFFELSGYTVEFVQAEILVAIPDEREKDGERRQFVDGGVPRFV